MAAGRGLQLCNLLALLPPHRRARYLYLSLSLTLPLSLFHSVLLSLFLALRNCDQWQLDKLCTSHITRCQLSLTDAI